MTQGEDTGTLKIRAGRDGGQGPGPLSFLICKHQWVCEDDATVHGRKKTQNVAGLYESNINYRHLLEHHGNHLSLIRMLSKNKYVNHVRCQISFIIALFNYSKHSIDVNNYHLLLTCLHY